MWTALILVASLSLEPPQVPSRLRCAYVRFMYGKYAKTHTLGEMEAYLRFKGYSEEKIAAARTCLR